MGSCGGNCGSCSGCGRELVMTEQEIELLKLLGQVAFLPIARTAADPAPICFEEGDSLVLQCLEKKGLVSLDFDKPLRGFDYGDHKLCGSTALTERGQKVLELMEYQGVNGAAD